MPDLARDHLIVALDVHRLTQARRVVRTLGDEVSHYKVGPYLFQNGLIKFIHYLRGQGKKVFLDFKSVDIGDTMSRMASIGADLGVDFITVMGLGSTVAAAAAGRGERSIPKILAVTLLTDHDGADMQREYNTPDEMSVEEFVCQRAVRAAGFGADGVICSPREIAAVRRSTARTKPDFLIVTPGVRPAGTATDDQKRTATPREAIAAGADFLVVGRPIIRAQNRLTATRAILDEMQQALDERTEPPRLRRAIG
jgi:orotidine-5'-phosphate decarboxylase